MPTSCATTFRLRTPGEKKILHPSIFVHRRAFESTKPGPIFPFYSFIIACPLDVCVSRLGPRLISFITYNDILTNPLRHSFMRAPSVGIHLRIRAIDFSISTHFHGHSFIHSSRCIGANVAFNHSAGRPSGSAAWPFHPRFGRRNRIEMKGWRAGSASLPVYGKTHTHLAIFAFGLACLRERHEN